MNKNDIIIPDDWNTQGLQQNLDAVQSCLNQVKKQCSEKVIFKEDVRFWLEQMRSDIDHFLKYFEGDDKEDQVALRKEMLNALIKQAKTRGQ